MFEDEYLDPRMNISMVTPVEVPFQPYVDFNRNRQNSNSSLASSVSDFQGSGRVSSNINYNSFSPLFIMVLMEMYQLACLDPTVTPFDSGCPPAGIISKVAKVAVEQADERNIDIGYERSSYLLTLVRHRLLQEVRKEYSNSNSGRDSPSLLSIAPPPQHFAALLSNQNNLLGINDRISESPAFRPCSYTPPPQSKYNGVPPRRPRSSASTNSYVLTPPSSESAGLAPPMGSSLSAPNIGTTPELGGNGGVFNILHPLLPRHISRTSSPLSTGSRVASDELFADGRRKRETFKLTR